MATEMVPARGTNIDFYAEPTVKTGEIKRQTTAETKRARMAKREITTVNEIKETIGGQMIKSTRRRLKNRAFQSTFRGNKKSRKVDEKEIHGLCCVTDNFVLC